MTGIEQWALGLPFIALPILVFAASFLEYVFPPFWGDMLVLLGFFVSGRSEDGPMLVFLAALAGSTLGAATAFSLGRRFGVGLVRRMTFRRRRRGTREKVRRLFLRFGEKILIINRFVPVVRGFFLYCAGGR